MRAKSTRQIEQDKPWGYTFAAIALLVDIVCIAGWISAIWTGGDYAVKVSWTGVILFILISVPCWILAGWKLDKDTWG